MSAQVTEAHLELAKTVIFSRDASGRLLTAPMAAKLIAESEARGLEAAKVRGDCLQREVDRWVKWNMEQPWLAEIRGYAHQVASLTSERDQLRAELATCKDASEALVESLRAELEKLNGGAK